jgi:hypothetical protein
MFSLISETWRGWHEEKARIKTAKRNNQMILFLSISSPLFFFEPSYFLNTFILIRSTPQNKVSHSV